MLPVNSLTPALAEQGQSPQRGSSPNPQGSRLCWPRRLARSPWNPGETDRGRQTDTERQKRDKSRDRHTDGEKWN